MGAHATASHGPAVLNVWTCSPLSVWVTSRPEPKKRKEFSQSRLFQTAGNDSHTLFAAADHITAIKCEA